MKQSRLFGLILTAALAVLVFTAVTPAVVSAADQLYVSESGWYRAGGAFNASDAPIQHAIDNATAGDSIFVYNGTYTDDVTVEKQLTLEGEGRDVVTVINSTADRDVFEVTADYVNILGFKVTGATDGAGIYLDSVEHCNISDNNCSNNRHGIRLNSSSDNNTLANNIVYGTTGDGIFLWESSNNNLSGNVVYDTGGDGICVEESSNSNTLANNIVYDNDNGDGIFMDSSSSNNLTDNIVNSNGHYGIYLYSSSSNNLVNNTANNNTGVWDSKGIVLEQSSDNVLTQNTANNDSEIGIWLFDNSHHNTLTDNNATHNLVGFWLEVNAHNNNLSGNYAYNNSQDGIVLDSSSNNNLSDNHAYNNTQNGLSLRDSNNNILSNNTASHNHQDGIHIAQSSNNDIGCGSVSYNGNIGIYIVGGGAESYNNVTGVLVTGNAIGIELENEDNCVIKDNTLNGNTGNGIYITGWSSHDNKIINNTVSNSYDGIYIESGNNLVQDNIANDNDHSGIQLVDCSDNEIIGNIANNNDYGISMWMWSNANHNITSNTVSDNSDCGIYMDYCAHCNINNNTVSSNRYGISAAGGLDSEMTCNWVHHNNERGINVACTGYNISCNNIIVNGVLQPDGSYHWNFYNDQANALNAKHNYWAAADNDTIDKSIYDDEDGNGEVIFYPFETTPPPCAPIPELTTFILLGVGLLVLAGYVRIRINGKG